MFVLHRSTLVWWSLRRRGLRCPRRGVLPREQLLVLHRVDVVVAPVRVSNAQECWLALRGALVAFEFVRSGLSDRKGIDSLPVMAQETESLVIQR